MKTNTTPSASSVQTTARTWIAKHPALKSRIERAVALVANVFADKADPGTYYVESSSEIHKVVVNHKSHSSKCDCMDYMIRVRSGKVYRCKHQLAVALHEVA